MDAAIWANVISGLAFTVSLAAAAFAWKSASEAKRANRISIHGYQKEVYQAFLNCRKHIMEKGSLAEWSEMSKLGPHVRTAKVYLDKCLADELVKFYESCYELSEFKIEARDAAQEVHDLTQVLQPIGPDNPPRPDDAAKAVSWLAECRKKIDAKLGGLNAMAVSIDDLFVEKIKLV